ARVLPSFPTRRSSDLIMTVFGSGANDAAFNAWVTESTTSRNRGRVDGVLAVMPLLSMLVVFGALDGLTQAGEWGLFFGIVGGSRSEEHTSELQSRENL